MNGSMARKLHTIVYRDGDTFVASGVELDIFAQGRSAHEAMSRLETVLVAEMKDASDAGRDLFDIGPAPASVQKLFRGPDDALLAKEERLVA